MVTTITGKPPFERLGLEGIPEGLSPEETEVLQKLQVQLVDFILHLIQAFLRTGYYTPEHPESKKAKEGLYEQFKSLFKMEDELAFLCREDPEGPNILVEGLLPEPQRLGRMMMRGMGELYVPKFAKYLERKDLASLTLKNRMGQTEFTRFIDIMSDPSQLDIRRKEDKEQFTQTLYAAGIFNISFVFNEEVVFAADREVPWRARLTLSRIRKELKMIPYFQKLTGEEIQEVGRNLVRDAVRAVKQPDILCAILQNCDVAASAVNPEEAIMEVILTFIQPQPFMGTSKIFLREHLAIKRLQKRDEYEERSDRLLTKIAARLAATEGKESEDLLEEYFRNHLIDLEALPPRLKDKILLERLTDKFLNYTQTFFQQLDQAKEKESFLVIAQSFLKMIPELIRRDRYGEVLRILEVLRDHFHHKKMWGLLAGQVLEEIGQGSVPQMLEEKFLTGKKEIRTAIIPIFIALEIGAIPSLLTILKTSDDQWVRKNACEALIQIGSVAGVHLVHELEAQKISIETTCDILRVLGEIKAQEWKGPLLKVLKRYVSHENPRLREQALHTLCFVGGAEGEGTFLAGLDDPDPEVRKRTVWCLGMIKSPKGAERILEMLKEIAAEPTPEKEPLETQIYHALGFFGNPTIQGKTVERLLIETLEKRGMKQWWGLFDKHALTDASLGAIVDTLGKIGTKESISVLTKLGKSREGPWSPKLRESLKRIEGRSGSGKS
jgi:hypothetical protein